VTLPVALDTNVLVRLLVNDDQVQAEQAMGALSAHYRHIWPALSPADRQAFSEQERAWLNRGRWDEQKQCMARSPDVASDADVLAAVTSHQFPPVTAIFWRNPELDLRSIPALRQSLAAAPPARWLIPAHDEEDERALAALAADPATPGANRRSIYRFTVRSVPDPFMDRLDCPDPSVITPKRNTTLTAVQALVMLNDPFVIRMAEDLASQAPTVTEAVRRFWLRNPSKSEAEKVSEYANKHGHANLCRLLLNTNEFLFVD
jgi:hypothetical protein